MMWRKLLGVNVVLAAILVAGGVRMQRSWNEFEANHRVETVQPEPEPGRTVPDGPTVTASAEDWTDISVKNPFSFDRNDVSIVAAKQVVPTRPKPVLFGTMSIGSERIAMLAPAQSGRASRPVKVGQEVDTWQVVEINDSSVVATAADGTRATIIMNDPEARVARASERTGTTSRAAAPANVISATPAAPTPTAAAASPAPAAATPQAPGAQPAVEMLNTPFGPVPRTKP
jgi:hypothetical protein